MASRSGRDRIDELGDIAFHGEVGKRLRRYCKETRDLARDVAEQLEGDSVRGHKAITALEELPQVKMRRLRMWRRSRLVVRHMLRARDLAQAISAESARLYSQYVRDFQQEAASQRGNSRGSSGSGRVRP